MTPTAHQAAMKLATQEYIHGNLETACRVYHDNRLQALLDDAGVKEAVARDIYLRTSRKGLAWPRVFSWGEYPEKDIYYAEAQAAIDAIKQIVKGE